MSHNSTPSIINSRRPSRNPASDIENGYKEKLLPDPKQLFVEQHHLLDCWKQIARWIQFEEIVQDGSCRWSKPFVPVASISAMEVLVQAFSSAFLFTDITASTILDFTNNIIEQLLTGSGLSHIDVEVLKETLLLPHVHQYEMVNRQNDRFREKLPSGLDGVCVLTGEVRGIHQPICIVARMKRSMVINHLLEIPLPIKFVFVYLSNNDSVIGSEEIGRAFATLITDNEFKRFCYTTETYKGIDEQVKRYQRKCNLLPPGWDPNIRLEPDLLLDGGMEEPAASLQEKLDEDYHFREESGLIRSGKIFGGLFNDVKRKLPYYTSDFKAIFDTQVISSTLFMYFACLTALITFGGLLAKSTGDNLAAIESIMGALVNGVIYGFLSGQPLSLLGSTGPMMIYESIVYELCVRIGWDYITLRLWIGVWVTLFLMVLVAMDASALMSYITRFTEESFSLVVCAIFLTLPMEYLMKIGNEKVFNYDEIDNYTSCLEHEQQDEAVNITAHQPCEPPDYDPAVFLMSTLLVTFTCAITLFLKNFKNTPFFAYRFRILVSEFAVFGTVLFMTGVDFVMGLNTDKLKIPDGLSPTLSTRGWFIHPFHPNNPMWSIFAAIVPAIVATILIFMNNQITISVICRKEHKLKKGVGFHLDLFLVTVLILLNSFFGLPWFNAAILLSIGHLDSLRVEAEPTTPGAKPRFLGYNEQRLSHILVSLLLGASLYAAPLLRNVPMPVLYGVFLYMGVASIANLQLLHRLALFFMPVKYMPDTVYLRKVS